MSLAEERQAWGDMVRYLSKMARIYLWNAVQVFNRNVLKTYPLIEECARCRDCGRNVHDFLVPNELWERVIGPEGGVWCYDCFSNRADKKLGMKWRLELVEKWNEAR